MDCNLLPVGKKNKIYFPFGIDSRFPCGIITPSQTNNGTDMELAPQVIGWTHQFRDGSYVCKPFHPSITVYYQNTSPHRSEAFVTASPLLSVKDFAPVVMRNLMKHTKAYPVYEGEEA